MRNKSSMASMVDLKPNYSKTHINTSFSSSKISLSGAESSSLYHRKGFSFGSSHRNSLMSINLVSPAAKYNIKGVMELSLDKKKGPSFGLSRQSSIQKTPFSYLSNNNNPGPGAYTSQQIYRSTSSTKIGTLNSQSLRIQFLNQKSINKNPGPGTYHPKVVKLKGGKISEHAKRFEKQNKENVPGPGSYNLGYASELTSKGPKISLKKARS